MLSQPARSLSHDAARGPGGNRLYRLREPVRLKRRQPQAKWTPAEVVGDIAAAYFGDADQYAVRVAVVVRYPYERLPKAVLDEWKADAETEQPGRGMPSHGVFQFDFSDDDRVALYMDHDKSAVIRNVVTAFDNDEASAAVIEWVGESGQEAELENVPGVYLSALIEAVTGVERFWNEHELAWWLPGDGPYVPYRKYPPPVNEAVGFVLMPTEVRQATFRQFLLSPTQESALRRR